jgi:outer membrane protein insertion porin family
MELWKCAVLLIAGCADSQVEFEGNRAISSSELRAVTRIDDEPTAEADVLERDVLLLHAAYYDRGFLDVNVVASYDTPEILFQVREGRRFELLSLEVTGDSDLRSMMAVRDGDWFDRAAIVDGLERILTLYRNAGYAHVEAYPEVTVDEQHATARVRVPIRLGPIARIDEQ